MELIALVLAIVAVVMLVARKDVAVGLALLGTAWIVQLVLDWVSVSLNVG